MATNPMNDYKGISEEQLNLIQQFEADYNAVDHFLRKVLSSDRQTSFRHLVVEYSRKHKGWHDDDLLRKVAEVRNAIVHEKTEPYRYIAVPTHALVQELKACRNRLEKPDRVIPTFQRKVETVNVDDTLTRALKIIRQNDISQFPVYEMQRDESKQFKGLLTENGITRWFAFHVSTILSLVELDEIYVGEVLKNEERRTNYRFAARDILVDEMKGFFVSNEMLEAVLITASGKKSEKLLGIATRWDIIHLI